MNLISGYPFWLIKDGLPFNYPALEKSISTDVLIIGGGISGALACYHLVNAGVKCVIVDSRTIGLGSTCASTSLLQYEIDTPLSELIELVGEKNAVLSYKLCEEAIGKIGTIDKKIKCGEFEAKRSLYYAANKKHLAFLKGEFATRKAHGFKVSFLDEKSLKNHYTINAPGAILSETAAQTNAYKFTHALLQFCKQKGIDIYDRTNVVDIRHQRNDVVVKTANGCRIKANKLVYANGYEAVKCIDKKIVHLHSTYATISEQNTADVDLWEDELLIWNTADPYLYVRSTKDRRIIVGGRDEPFINAHKSNSLITSKSKLLKKDIGKLFPYVDYKPEFNWSGIFGSTIDGLPFIGTLPGKPNGYFALGFGGNGITFSLMAAEIIADIITKGKSKYTRLFGFERI
jgi:glycine/D-amino acid oxidase-like deaminating enzyme